MVGGVKKRDFQREASRVKTIFEATLFKGKLSFWALRGTKVGEEKGPHLGQLGCFPSFWIRLRCLKNDKNLFS